ncbi:hypothetical protein N5J43_26550 [Pseudomonas nicosulfuronedens]|nr:hypothetical protein [Pseudomonas nicosulfuronedens]MDH1007826.1 hypothetical protein [Pseudomonas nicosulfuronedens]MDH1982530.1 hypothetical protein [Pseudomonas nicosulfuronedens]MDH2024937.1 hypothetical protein [Pseudomonas nicosulfuronedens]
MKLFVVLFVGLLSVVLFLYAPGLHGDFEFDDSANIIDNNSLHITALDLKQLRAAAVSGDAGPTGRPLALISFALNIYFFGMQPFYFKLINVLIHLCNIVLVAGLSSLILRRWYSLSARSGALAGLAVAALWGVHPINLTSILYVVQRMTSLSALFGFLAIYLYVRWRSKPSTEQLSLKGGLSILLILLALVLSMFSKESGVLFVLLLAWIEYCVFEFKSDGRVLRLGALTLRYLVTAVGLAMALVALVWVIPPMISPGAFAQRDFTLSERLLTESRVIFFYLAMIVYPVLSSLSLYHDDFTISTSLTQPDSTVYAVFGIVLLWAICLFGWRRYRMLSFAIGWFFISHLLESTVFSLELVHEHRNYFASIGLLCFLVGVGTQLRGRVRVTLMILGAAFFLLFSFVTYNRSLVWSSLVDHAVYEAEMHPRSDRANYQMGRIYLKLLDNSKDMAFAAKAREYFQRSADAYLPANGSYFALIHLAYYLNEKADPLVVQRLQERLRTLPFYNSNVAFLRVLVDCQLGGFCHLPPEELVALLAASLENPRAAPESRSSVYLLLGRYFIESIGDLRKGEEFFRDSINVLDAPGARIMLVQALRMQGRFAEALDELKLAAARDRLGANAQWIVSEHQRILQAQDNKVENHNAVH